MDVLRERCRQLRRNATDAESVLWYQLRGRRLAGSKFRRQHPCGPFILDFYCAQRRLAIELDGGQHAEDGAAAYDSWRTRYLEKRGISVLRFPNDEVLVETESVLVAVAAALLVEGPHPDPSPRPDPSP